jgi:hypothetical protein
MTRAPFIRIYKIQGCYSKLHSVQDREEKRIAMRRCKQYGEEPCSEVDECIGLNAT